MRRLLTSMIGLLLLAACTGDPVIDLESLQVKAKEGDRAAIETLVDLLTHQDQALSDRVYQIIVATGKPVAPVLLAKASSADRQQREYVLAALGTLKVTQAIPEIAKVLVNPALERRYVAAWALGEIGDSAGIQPLIDALEDANSEVRRYATRALIKLNQRAVEPLIKYLEDARGEGAAGAIRALGDIADARALDVLLAQTDSEQKAEAFLALGKLRDPRAESALVVGLSDPDDRVRMNAAMALGPLGGPLAAEALARTLEDEVHVVREWSARSLEMITGQPVEYRNSHGESVRPYQVYH